MSGFLKIDIRRGRILEKLKQTGTVSVAQLAEELGATPVTIRSDLDALEAEGYLVRVQGGAVQSQRTAASGLRVQSLSQEKLAIAKAVADMVADGDTLFINSGTTMHAVADALRVRKNLNVVTNSLTVAAMMGSVPGFRVILLGGEVNARFSFSHGSDALEQLSHYGADWAILSLDGVDLAGGLTTYHAEEAAVNRMMIRGAKQVLAAAEHKKVGKKGFSRFWELGPEICLVTDEQVAPSAVKALEEKGVQVIIAKKEG